MRYVYLLQSESFAGQRCVGIASNLKHGGQSSTGIGVG